MRQLIQPGSKEAHLQIHRNLFGSTKRWEQHQPQDTPMERLEKIHEMLFWNMNKIQTAYGQLNDPFDRLHLFTTKTKLLESIEFNKKVRIRLIRYWNRQLRIMRLVK